MLCSTLVIHFGLIYFSSEPAPLAARRWPTSAVLVWDSQYSSWQPTVVRHQQQSATLLFRPGPLAPRAAACRRRPPPPADARRCSQQAARGCAMAPARPLPPVGGKGGRLRLPGPASLLKARLRLLCTAAGRQPPPTTTATPHRLPNAPPRLAPPQCAAAPPPRAANASGECGTTGKIIYRRFSVVMKVGGPLSGGRARPAIPRAAGPGSRIQWH